MKKLFILLFSIFFLFGCSNEISKEDLQANEWIADISHLGENVQFDVVINDNTIDAGINRNSAMALVKEELGEDNALASLMLDSVIAEFNQTLQYELTKDGAMVSTLDNVNEAHVTLNWDEDNEKNIIVRRVEEDTEGTDEVGDNGSNTQKDMFIKLIAK